MTNLSNLKKSFPFLLLLVLLVIFVAPRAAAQEDGSSPINLSVSAGFDAYYKNEHGVPVKILVSNDGAPVEGELRIELYGASSSNRVVYSAPVSLPTQSNKRVNLYLHLPSFVGELTVELRSSSGQLLESAATPRLSQLAPEDLLYGVISSDPGELSNLEDIAGSRSNAEIAFLTMDDLPDVAVAWNALDILLFDDTDTAQLTSDQLSSLRSWVDGGGQLVATGGPGWQKTAAALSEMLPVAVTGSETVDDLPALSQQTGQAFRDAGPYLVSSSSLLSGELLYHQDGLPLLARRPWGRGMVYFLALDPKLAPMLDWDGSEQIWSAVANQVPTRPKWGRQMQDSYAATSAVTSLPSLTLPSVLQLIGFLFVYVIAVGPVNYLVLKRSKRRELAWATIPAIVILFSGIAYFTGFRIKGNDVILNQLAVAYGRTDSEQMRVQSLIGLYSPRRQAFDLALPGSAMARPLEGNYGSVGGSGNIDAISRSGDLTITGVRVDVSNIETFIAESFQPSIDVSGSALLSMDSGILKLNITIQNDSETTLENASIIFGDDVYVLGDLAPGQRIDQTETIGVPAVSSGKPLPGVTTAPMYISPPGSGSPLTSNAEKLLGTSDYYNDRKAYPRWQLLVAIEGDMYATGPSGVATGSGQQQTVTLIAWSDDQQLDVKINRDDYRRQSTTLYFLELPFQQNIISGDHVSVPVSLLNWSVLGESGVYNSSIHNLYLQDGWVEFEYQPWPLFQNMNIDKLDVSLRSVDESSANPLPQVRLWNFKTELWDTVEQVGWGITPISDPDSYIDPQKKVRMRLQGRGNYSGELQEIYPILTGALN